MSDIFREVEEDVRNARLKALWDSYGILVIGAAIAIVAATALGVYWQDTQRQKREAAASQFLAGEKLLLEGKTADAVQHFAKMAEESPVDGYVLLARLKEAAAKLEAGDSQGAIAAYDMLAADSTLDPLLRAVASFKASLLLFDTASADELKLRLNPLAKDDAPLRHSARELLAHLALRENSPGEARTLFQGLADALDAPRGIRARAAEILQTLPPAAPAVSPSNAPAKK
ncbi:MAG: tetratricopeptide repeat protein [Pseudomonadota bacterium]